MDQIVKISASKISLNRHSTMESSKGSMPQYMIPGGPIHPRPGESRMASGVGPSVIYDV